MRPPVATQRTDHLWLIERTSAALTGYARGIKVEDERGRIRGMVVYDNETPASFQAHMAVETPIAWRALLPAVFEYPFIQCEKAVLLGVIPAGNLRSCRMVDSLGFRTAHRIRNGWAAGEDLVLFEMRRDECRYLPGYSEPRRRGYREDSILR